MTIESILIKIEEWAGEKFVIGRSLSGGCISNAQIITSASGKSYFLKTGNHGKDLFIKEANGLNELNKSGAIKAPNVNLAEYDFILSEFIETGIKGRDFFRLFGHQFANLHKFTGYKFGFFEDNYIGANKQINITSPDIEDNWVSFYFNNRLLYQMQLAEHNGYSDSSLRKAFSVIENKIEIILSGSDEPPALLHGDLWSGNYMCNSKSQPVIIDPAVYYGHREADLAMTKLFGGFSTDFYSSYQETYPLPDGFEYRENIYILYHVLNHLNLFGGGYYGQAIRLMKYYM